jgi:succinate dehydrogenase/fumarate reductase flavoprotein subunit
MSHRYNVIVVGAGNTAYSAAHAAAEQVGSVHMLEKAP